MKIKIIYSNKAVKDLRKIGKHDTQKILKKIKYYVVQNNIFRYAKKLKPPFDSLYRFRIGVYRIIFRIDTKGNISILIVLKIEHRKNIY